MTGLAELLERVGSGVPLPATGAVTNLSAPSGHTAAVVLGFPAHHVIAADADPAWLTSQMSGDEMTRPLKPDFLAALGEHLDAKPGGQDTLLVARGDSARIGRDDMAIQADAAALNHARVERARRYRDDVRVATTPGGLVTIGRGLAGRWEISIEVQESRRGAGIGRALAEYGRTLVPAGTLVWAQVHPANVASLRVFLAAGYRPVGAEVLSTRETENVAR